MKKAECRNFVINRTWDKKKKSQEFASSLLSLLKATHAREELYALVLLTWSSSFVKHILYCPYMYVFMYVLFVYLQHMTQKNQFKLRIFRDTYIICSLN